jgi:hypothetical protein
MKKTNRITWWLNVNLPEGLDTVDWRKAKKPNGSDNADEDCGEPGDDGFGGVEDEDGQDK